MQRLLTVTGTAALIVAAIVFNSVRYPCVSEQLWRASQAAHGPPSDQTLSAEASTASSSSPRSERGSPAENGTTNGPGRHSATSASGFSDREPSDRAGESVAGATPPSETPSRSTAEGRFTPEAAGSPNAAPPTAAERAVWPTWRSDSAASNSVESTPTPPQPFGLTPRPGDAASGESSRPGPSPAAAGASGLGNMPWPPTAPSATAPPTGMRSTTNEAPTPGAPVVPHFSNTMPRTPSAPLPVTNPAELVPIADPVPNSERTAGRTAEPTNIPRPGAEPSQAAPWSPAAPRPAPGSPTATSPTTSPPLPATSPTTSLPAGSSLSTAAPPPAPIPDNHRHDLVAVANTPVTANADAPVTATANAPRPVAAANGGPPGSSPQWRRLPPVDDLPTAPINPQTTANLPAYPSTRTP